MHALMPNIDTAEKADLLMKAITEQENAHHAIVRFVNDNERDIEAALRFAMSRSFISNDKDHELEDKDGDILEAFTEVMKTWRAAIDKSLTLMATGKTKA